MNPKAKSGAMLTSQSTSRNAQAPYVDDERNASHARRWSARHDEAVIEDSTIWRTASAKSGRARTWRAPRAAHLTSRHDEARNLAPPNLSFVTVSFRVS